MTLGRIYRFFVRDIPDWRSGTLVVVLFLAVAFLTAHGAVQGCIIAQQKALLDFYVRALWAR